MYQCAKATLLAGFAFAQLTGYEYDEPDEGYFTFEQLTAMGIAHISEDASARGVAGWSWLTGIRSRGCGSSNTLRMVSR